MFNDFSGDFIKQRSQDSPKFGIVEFVWKSIMQNYIVFPVDYSLFFFRYMFIVNF